MTETQAREEICRVGKSLFDRGYVHASAGNVSMRLDDGFLITPTDACLGFLEPTQLARLDAEARAFIARSDTLFVATQAPAEAAGPDVQTSRGADVSHRGGRPGFVKLEDELTFLVPDFTGNFFFMTLGNLQLNPRAGVLFIGIHDKTGEVVGVAGPDTSYPARFLRPLDDGRILHDLRFVVPSGSATST